MKPPAWIIVGALLLAGMGTGGYVYWNGDQKALVRYKTAKIERGTVTQAVTATGTINPVITVQVGSQVSGIIKRLYADFNSVVKGGQVVAQIDPAPFQTAVTQMEANLQNALGSLARARADLSLQKLNFDRAKVLFEQQLNAQQDVDNARTAYETSKANVQIAEAQVKQAQAQLDTAKVNLEYATIHSPVDGIVISRNVDVGQTVAASFQAPILFLIAKDLTKMQVDTNVSESDIGGLTEGKSATFVVDAYPNQVFKGKVTQVRNAPINVQNVVTYNVVIGVDNSDLRLRPGMTANVSIIVASHENVLRIPSQALRFKPGLAKVKKKAGSQSASASGKTEGDDQGGPSESSGRTSAEGKGKPTVWLPNPEGEPIAVKVKTGVTDGTYTELVEGALKEGDEVIVGIKTPKEPQGVGAGGALPPGFGSQPSDRPGTRMPRGL
ncbi:MAG: efflux RND transporter periplasmic adaptor subunit [Nitrospirae bacterium]|nr:MAG: efflux RND transporter periplasmic adaptor subunit [Nitrospirota bacterium]